MGHVVVCRSVLVADAVLDDGIGIAHALEEVPSVVAVAPCAAADIVVSGSGELLVCKTVGIATKISGTAAHRLVVEIIVGIAVENGVVATILHLDTRVATTIDIEILDEVITAVVDQAVLSGITDGKTLDMNILSVGGDTNTDIITAGHFASIGLCAEIENRLLSRKCADEGAFVLRETILGSADCLFGIKQVLTTEQIECIASGNSGQSRRPRSRRGVGSAVSRTGRRSVVRSSKGAK